MFPMINGKSEWMMTWNCLVYILNGRYSGICGGTSYGQMCNPSGRNEHFQINDDDDDRFFKF